MWCAFAAVSSGFVISELRADSAQPLVWYSDLSLNDSIQKPKPMTPEEKMRQVKERFSRLVSVDTVNFFGIRNSVGACTFSSRDSGVQAKGRRVQQRLRLLNPETCEYRSVITIYDKDSTSK